MEHMLGMPFVIFGFAKEGITTNDALKLMMLVLVNKQN
jgi:hypothetical protein